jgi:hypothetical protein
MIAVTGNGAQAPRSSKQRKEDRRDREQPMGRAQCGNDLSRENAMRQAASLHDFAAPMLLPGVTVNTSSTDFFPIKQEQLAKFSGSTWELFGTVIAMKE